MEHAEPNRPLLLPKKQEEMIIDEPTHNKSYQIKLFYTGLDISAMYLTEYTDLFGIMYKKCFITEDGNIYEISQVESWE